MTKKLPAIILLFIVFQTKAQDNSGRPFITGDTNFTLAINPHWNGFNEDDDESFLTPAAAFFRLGFGYEFKKRVAVSVNGGYDVHWFNDVDTFPIYLGLKYNIFEKYDDAFFSEVRYGKLFTTSPKYPDGDYFAIGLGWQMAGEKRWNLILRTDYHEKQIIGFKNSRLASLSFGIGFSFF
jgi:hypothetical protein